MDDLSPLAQKILDATYLVWEPQDPHNLRRCVAAAFRVLDAELGHPVLTVGAVDSSQIQLLAKEMDGGEVSA